MEVKILVSSDTKLSVSYGRVTLITKPRNIVFDWEHFRIRELLDLGDLKVIRYFKIPSLKEPSDIIIKTVVELFDEEKIIDHLVFDSTGSTMLRDTSPNITEALDRFNSGKSNIKIRSSLFHLISDASHLTVDDFIGNSKQSIQRAGGIVYANQEYSLITY